MSVCAQLPLFPDLVFVPTKSMVAGTSTVWQCRWCGTLVCIPAPPDGDWVADDRNAKPTNCPSCASSGPGQFTRQVEVGPFQTPESVFREYLYNHGIPVQDQWFVVGLFDGTEIPMGGGDE